MNNWSGIIQEWLFPPTCLLCGDPGLPSLDLCQRCHDALPRNHPACPRCGLNLPDTGPPALLCGRCQKKPPVFTEAVIPFRYDEPIRHLLHGLKFHERVASARPLGLLLWEYVSQRSERPQYLIPVPLHPARYRARGYNQATEIARVVASRLGIPLDLRTCVRDRATRPQAELPAQKRRGNLKGAFRVLRTPQADHVAILDDIVTTGTTVNELAKCLCDAGVKRVDVWAVARA